MTKSNCHSLKDVLYPNGTVSFTDEQRETLLEQYKLFVETSEKLVARRQTVNAFFLSINTLTLSVVGFVIGDLVEGELQTSDVLLAIIPVVAGILFCSAWITLVRSFRQLNEGKFQVIHLLEDQLPASVFRAEWYALGEGKEDKKYVAFTRTEKLIPYVFIVSYILVLVVNFAKPLCEAVSNCL